MGLLVYCRAREKGEVLSCPEINVCSAFSKIIAKRMGLWGTIDHTLQVSSLGGWCGGGTLQFS